eukprot:CAMPEP_0172410364 /NCGR_PEP_ID=MMETSP1061-20121228/76842_1 /TAXON_ID=37318 /ORGANISM="Pseudo-nitzschia pungens, Strain cf. pungens" /LENGTH=1615 /DNA_ID=CAMNT_0013146543 /DNA_START=169 /DNA_END=5017 /DNA_ORIENTATION=-
MSANLGGEEEKDVSKHGGDKKRSIRKRLGLSSKNKKESKSKGSRSSSTKRTPKSSSSSASTTTNNTNNNTNTNNHNNNNNNALNLTTNNHNSGDTIFLDLNESGGTTEDFEMSGISLASAASIATNPPESGSEKSSKRSGRGERRGSRIGRVVRSLSRSRSSKRGKDSRRGRDGSGSDTDNSSEYSSSSVGRRSRSTVVTVTSCRSDGYYNQKAPGSTSKLPRKAPTNLKLFHELAVGLKDAFMAVGQTPTKPQKEEEVTDEATGETKTVAVMSDEEFQGRTILWDFMGNIDFLLALVDEVAVDTATRGALKDDTTFKGLRDVIKKCNKVLEDMLGGGNGGIRFFFRLPQTTDARDMDRIRNWNEKVERAVGAVTESNQSGGKNNNAASDSDSDLSSMAGSTVSSSSKGSVFSRGRQLLPVAGRVRSRRATPTPRLRKRAVSKEEEQNSSGNAAEDGFAAASPVTQGNLAALQRSFQTSGSTPMAIQNHADQNSYGTQQPQQQLVSQAPVIQPKDELVDVIRGLRLEKIQHRESSTDSDLTALKPDWRPKADIPSAVPKLPTEYIHRHRLMKQVVSCLLEQTGAGPRDTDEEYPSEQNAIVTSITSRHGDKAGNGKTILAVAAIQTVEVRERFTDGIAWIHLGRGPLSERDIRRLYEELYRQLVVKAPDDSFFGADYDYLMEDETDNGTKSGEVPSRGSSFDGNEGKTNSGKDESRRQRLATLAETRQRFQGGDLEGIKEDFARLLAKKKVLICLDDVWRVEDAKWFIFDNQVLNRSNKTKKKRRSSSNGDDDEYLSRILMTTRTPNLLGPGLVQEVFVRILSETEAVKLLLSTAGRRPYGGKNSTVFHQAKLIVKGCGNSPLAVRVSGSMLRHSNRSWNINSPCWSALIHQCRLNLEEASQLRSFVNAVNRVVDLSFFTVADVHTRIALRRCFVAFAMAFRDNDWMLSGRGVPHSVVLRVFKTIISSDEASKDISPGSIVTMLQNLNLMDHARHGVASRALSAAQKLSLARKQSRSSSDNDSDSDWDDEDEAQIHKAQQSWVMHESLKSVAEEMAKRSTPCLSPETDDFTSYSGKIEEERKICSASSTLWHTPLRFFEQQLSNGSTQLTGFQENETHKIVLTSLLEVGDGMTNTNSVLDTLREGQIDVAVIPGGDKMEEYIVTFFPGHLIRCEIFSTAAEVLSDPHFIGRRANALGIVEATSRQVADLQELRRLAGNATLTIPRKSTKEGSEGKVVPTKVDVNSIVREGSRIIIDEISRVATKNDNKPDSLGLAMCFAAIGEGLMKSRQPRDAMLRLEEAVGLYKELLGTYNTRVADALQTAAKALVKLGESRIALLKFAEAARIYESCNATLHYNSIANAQSLASLLVDLGDMEKAQSMFEEVISMRKIVYGEHSVPVAKTINAYAILLAKHGRMNVALQNYESAKGTYLAVPAPLVRDPEFEIKCKYDVTLINLNIASIRSKKGDLREAITCYEEGVAGLRQYENALAELHKDPLRPPESGKNTAHKHLVAALGRIGSLKLKIGDNNGALRAYTSLLEEVKDSSPSASQTEKAKAHIKCATIYRQKDGTNSHELSVSHLKQALEMYKAIFGPDHKDTAAISSSLRQWLAEDQ